MQNTKTHLPSVLTLVILSLSILFLISIVLILGFGSLISLFQEDGTAAVGMIGAVSFGFSSLTLGVCAWFVLQKARGRESADMPFTFPFASWQIFAVIGLAFMGVVIGGAASLLENQVISWLILPVTTILVIVPPIWLFYGIGSNGIEAGPRWRFFAVFGLSMTIAPAIMIVLELVILATVIVGGAVYMSLTQPGLIAEITQLSQRLMNVTDEVTISRLLSPYVSNPAVIAVVLGYIALIVPLIEELFKPLAVWFFARQIESPAQGFVLGMLSGAAFGLFESLNASADGSTGWATIVIARAGTGILHMMLSGLVGWGIIMAFKERKYGRLAGAYISAVLIHGVWNAAAAGIGISVLGKPEWLYSYAPALICGLILMSSGIFAMLIASNRKMRQVPAVQTPEEEQVQLTP